MNKCNLYLNECDFGNTKKYGKNMNEELLQKLEDLTAEEKNILKSGMVDINYYTKRKSKKISGATYFEDGNEVYFRRHPRFAKFPEHGHDYTEIMIVAAGTITHYIDGSRITLSAGDVLVLNKFARHSICTTGKNDIGLNFLLSDKFVLSFIQKTEVAVLKRFFEENFISGGAADFIVFKSGFATVINNLIENLVCISFSEKMSKSRALSLTLSVLLEQMPYFSEKFIIHRKTDCYRGRYLENKEDKYRNAISTYIEDEFAAGTLSGCARKLGINEQYLSRMTKSLFGKTFKQLLIEKRISESESLLHTDTLTISEIAAAIGYENVYGFDVAFQKIHGVKPSVWRNNNKSIE